MRLFFWFNHILDARAEIKLFLWWKIKGTKNSFWSFLTFKELWYDDKTHSVKEGELMFKSMGQTDGNLFFEKSEWFTPLQHLDSKKNGGISVLKGNKVVSIGKSIFFFILWTFHRYRWKIFNSTVSKTP